MPDPVLNRSECNSASWQKTKKYLLARELFLLSKLRNPVASREQDLIHKGAVAEVKKIITDIEGKPEKDEPSARRP